MISLSPNCSPRLPSLLLIMLCYQIPAPAYAVSSFQREPVGGRGGGLGSWMHSEIVLSGFFDLSYFQVSLTAYCFKTT